VTDDAAGFAGPVAGADLVRLAAGAYQERSAQVSWPG
jgi:hypothetical protein